MHLHAVIASNLYYKLINPLMPVLAVNGCAKTTPQMPVLARTGRKKHVRTIAFPTIPEDFLVLLLFFCFKGQINQ